MFLSVKKRTPILVSFVLLLGMVGGVEAAIYLDSGAVGAGPYCLDVAGETYVLTEDIATSGSGLVFAAENVTLDLNQHTVTFGTSSEIYRYGVAIPPPYPHGNSVWAESDITVWEQSSGATVMNGAVAQGAGSGAKCAAIIAYEQSSLTVQGTSVLIRGDDTFAIQFNECDDIHIFGNTITDSTTVVTNRHAGRAAIDMMATHDGPIEIFSNTIQQMWFRLASK